MAGADASGRAEADVPRGPSTSLKSCFCLEAMHERGRGYGHVIAMGELATPRLPASSTPGG